MNYYSYKAIDPDGAVVRGVAEAEDMTDVFESLATKGLSILDVRKENNAIAYIKKAITSRKIRRTDIIEFATNLSIMLRAGVPLFTALDDISAATENKKFRDTISDMKRLIETGMRFSDAVESQKGMFPHIFVRITRIGEETGRLDKSLSDVAEHLQKMEDLAQAIKRALMYPVFAIVTTLGALIFWLAYVLPKIMAVMKDMGVKLPLITRILLHVSNFMKIYWFVIPLAPVVITAAIYILKRNETTKYYIDVLKLKFPIVKLIVYNKLLALFSEQMRILIVAGITIDRTLSIVADVMGNEVFRTALSKVKENVSAGYSIAESLKEHERFPQLMIRMIGVGETSGTLEEQFAFLSNYYLKKLDDISQKMGKMVEPIVISVIGALFAVIIIGLMLPIYDLVSGIGRR